MKTTRSTSMTKWLITAGTLAGTLTGWIFLASGSANSAREKAAAPATDALGDLLANPLPTLAAPLSVSANAMVISSPTSIFTPTPHATLRSVQRPTAIPVYSGGSSQPAASGRTGSSK